jgi:hypothetical protein
MVTIAKDCAGWDLNQADALRKITKLKGKDPDLVLRTEAGFISDCMEYSHMKYSKAKEIAKFDRDSSYVGIFAQDVEKVLPEAVKLAPFDNDGYDNSISGENYLTIQYEKISLERAQIEIPEEELLDIGILLFDPNIPDEDNELIFPEIRKAEARYIPYHLKKTLQDTGF